MTDDDLLPSDLSMKKKRRKKKTGFDLDAAMGDDTGPTADGQPTPAAGDPQEEDDDEPTDSQPAPKSTDDFSMDFINMKKKKKKKNKFDLEEVGDALPETTKVEIISNTAADSEFNFEDLNFNNRKKKKPKRLVNVIDGADDVPGDDGEHVGEGDETRAHSGWIGSDRDYIYDELLTRVFNIMREKNPDMIAGEKKKFAMRPPQVLRVGSRKTSFANFADICRLLHRQPKHVLAFLLAELGTSGSVDGNNQLIIRGKYTQKQIENVLRGYIKEYVTCHTCRSRDTLLQKDTRLFFLQCETCGSRCSVTSIKTGFQAVTSKRAAIRAKTA